MAITKLLPTSFFSVMCGQVCSRGSQERMFFLLSDILLYAKKSGSLDKDQRYERTRVLAYNLFVKRFFAPATKRTKKDSRKTIFSNSLLVVIQYRVSFQTKSFRKGGKLVENFERLKQRTKIGSWANVFRKLEVQVLQVFCVLFTARTYAVAFYH